MTIDLVFPALPPALDGIGDHTALLAEALHRAGCSVRVHTAQPNAAPIPGVDVSKDFDITNPWNVRRLASAVAADPPDWLLVQFNQFSYGRYGFNPWLPWTLREIQRRNPEVRIAWMAHEDFVPPKNWKFAIMRQWQRWQFRKLGEIADSIFFSIDPWVRKYQSWFPETPVFHLPVGSNIPHEGCSRMEARQAIGIDLDAFVVGVFGTMRASRLPGHIRAAVLALHERDPQIRLLYVGPDGEALQAALPGISIIDAGRLPASEVSVHLSAMDIHLAPFVDGLSTRRGSAMAGLQHGVTTLSTDGPLTDTVLRDLNRSAFVLTPVESQSAYAQSALELYPDDARRLEISQSGQRVFNNLFSWEAIAERLITTLGNSSQGVHSVASTGDGFRHDTEIADSTGP